MTEWAAVFLNNPNIRVWPLTTVSLTLTSFIRIVTCVWLSVQSTQCNSRLCAKFECLVFANLLFALVLVANFTMYIIHIYIYYTSLWHFHFTSLFVRMYFSLFVLFSSVLCMNIYRCKAYMSIWWTRSYSCCYCCSMDDRITINNAIYLRMYVNVNVPSSVFFRLFFSCFIQWKCN